MTLLTLALMASTGIAHADEGECTFTQGYWQNHNAFESKKNRSKPWPISEDTMLCGDTWLDILHMSVSGDAAINVEHQYIAARLNLANGAGTTSDVDAAIALIEMALDDCTIDASERADAIDAKDVLDDYNNNFGETTWYADGDGDGHGADGDTVVSCLAPEGYAQSNDDCDDSRDDVNPGEIDNSCDGIDSDCDGRIDESYADGAALVTWSRINQNTLDELDLVSGTVIPAFQTFDTAADVNSLAGLPDSPFAYMHTRVTAGLPARELVEIDVATPAYTVLGSTAGGNTAGMAMSPNGDLYAVDSATDQFEQYDIMTGEGTAIGPLGFNLGNTGLSYSCEDQQFIGVQVFPAPTRGDGFIFTIDLATGAATRGADLDPSFFWKSAGLQYEPATGKLLLLTRSGLYRVDVDTGLAAQVIAIPPATDPDDVPTGSLSYVMP